jgi:hypothetical protein
MSFGPTGTYASVTGPTCVIRVNFSPMLVILDPQMPKGPTCTNASESGPYVSADKGIDNRARQLSTSEAR